MTKKRSKLKTRRKPTIRIDLFAKIGSEKTHKLKNATECEVVAFLKTLDKKYGCDCL